MMILVNLYLEYQIKVRRLRTTAQNREKIKVDLDQKITLGIVVFTVRI